jgi:NAD(P)-dependent dehydrogenase (short-subunit alcohol dehydrogenase family)
MASLQNKVAIVTGGASGIGAAIVKLFLSSGAKVAIFDIQNALEPSTDPSAHFVKVNVTSEESVKSAVSEVISKWGKLDVLVNNAGIMDRMSRAADTTNDIWEKCFAVNVTGPFHLIREAIPIFQKQETKGNIVNICSTASIRGSAAGTAYTTSKHAILGLTRSTAWGYAKEGIRTNAILPGGVRTPIMDQIKTDTEGKAALASYVQCMPSVGEPEHIANAALFLATAPSVNGAEIAVDNGWTMS